LAALGLILMLFIPGVWIPSYINRSGNGWWSVTPTPILMWVLGRQTNPNARANNVALQELINSRFLDYVQPGPIHSLLVSQAVERLISENSANQRRFGVWVLGALAVRGRGLDALVSVAKSDPDQGIRESALIAIGTVRPRSEVIMPLART